MMMFSSLLLSLLILVIGRQIWHKRHRHHKARYLTILTGLKDLLVLLQAFRDASYQALLSPQRRDDLSTLREQIVLQIEVLTRQPFLARNQRWLGFTEHWQRQQTVASRQGHIPQFEQQTMMMVNLIPLLEETAEAGQLTRQQLSELPNIALVWRELPMLIEYLGQAKAFAHALCSDKPLNSEEQLRLTSVQKQLRRLSRVTFHHIRYNGPPEKEQEFMLHRASQFCEEFVNLLDKQRRADQTSPDDQQLARKANASIRAAVCLMDWEYNKVSDILHA